MTRKKKLFLNTISSLIYQVIALICGFILPQFMISAFGSEVNGLLSSITHFLGFITLAECGVGAVVQSALYKPLAEKNNEEISKIIISSDRFFRKIAFILIVYTVAMMIFYPMITIESFDYLFTASLILIISFSSFVQYYFSMSYSLLLSADAMGFIPMVLRSITLVLNTIITILLVKIGSPIHIVKLVSSLIFLIQPLFLVAYTKKYYNLDKSLTLTEEPIKQKWNGLLQHIAAVVLGNTDIVILTMFSSLKNVSIYSVYNLVVNGIKQLLLASTDGIQALFGEMYAKNEINELNKTFSYVEWIIHTATTFVFTCTAILIVPFVSVYTKNFNDANYIVPTFGVLITIATAIICIRIPYIMMAYAAGHFKETQTSAIIEVVLNILVSMLFIFKYELVGVAIGTIVALSFRTLYFVWYLSKNILYRPTKHFLKYIFTELLTIVLIIPILHFVNIEVINYFTWFIYAIIVSLITLSAIVIVNLIFYYGQIKKLIEKVGKRI